MRLERSLEHWWTSGSWQWPNTSAPTVIQPVHTVVATAWCWDSVGGQRHCFMSGWWAVSGAEARGFHQTSQHKLLCIYQQTTHHICHDVTTLVAVFLCFTVSEFSDRNRMSAVKKICQTSRHIMSKLGPARGHVHFHSVLCTEKWTSAAMSNNQTKRSRHKLELTP